MSTLPPHIRATYCGEIPPRQQVVDTLQNYHLFFLPTLAENFGYVILEALTAGCIVLTSDRSPWNKVGTAKAGWYLPLEQPDRFHEALQATVDLDDEAFRRMSANAVALAGRYLANETSVADSIRLLRAAIP